MLHSDSTLVEEIYTYITSTIHIQNAEICNISRWMYYKYLHALVMAISTMYNFHDSTDIFVNPSFLPFCTQKAPWISSKKGILVPKVAYDLPEFKIRLLDHIAIIHAWSMEHMCIKRFAQKCQSNCENRTYCVMGHYTVKKFIIHLRWHRELLCEKSAIFLHNQWRKIELNLFPVFFYILCKKFNST